MPARIHFEDEADGTVPVSQSHPLPATLGLVGVQIGADIDTAFANSAGANTQKTIDIAAPTSPAQEYLLSIYNPSTVTDLTVKVFSTCLLMVPGTPRTTAYSLITTVTIPKSQSVSGTTVNAYAKLLHGLFMGTDVRLVVSNDTVLGGGDGFSFTTRLREVSN